MFSGFLMYIDNKNRFLIKKHNLNHYKNGNDIILHRLRSNLPLKSLNIERVNQFFHYLQNIVETCAHEVVVLLLVEFD